MKSLIGGLIGLVLSVHVGAEPLLEGRVRLSSGQPAVGVQVRLFDLTDLRRSVGTTTDEPGILRCRCERSLRTGARLCRPILRWGRITPTRSIPPPSFPTNCRRRAMCGWTCSMCWGSGWRR